MSKARENKNYRYWIKRGKDYEWGKRLATKKELSKAREGAFKAMKKKGNPVFRSCWECNPAHYHFLRGDWGDWVLLCLECGHYYYDKIDITEYEKSD